MRIGVAALARPTFDVPFAEEMAARAFADLDGLGLTLVGGRGLLFDAAATTAALQALAGEQLDAMLILQVSFTDATMTVEIARSIAAPLAIWAFPEPRAGGRLRLNSFCGLNLAQHALGRAGKRAAYLYAPPGGGDRLAGDLRALLAGGRTVAPAVAAPVASTADEQARAGRALAALQGLRIGLVGEHPAGFDTCRFDDAGLAALTGTTVERIPLGDVFETARGVPAGTVAGHRGMVAGQLAGLDAVNQGELDRSLTVYEALRTLATTRGANALAVRCWPEMFTEYGCAACGPMGLLNEGKLPAACEADVLGALSHYLLQELAGDPAWLVDIVDMAAGDDTGVFWHCGSAPLSMRDPESPAEAQIHSNRRMPLLQQFTLKPGRITIARLTQAQNRVQLVVGGGEVIRRPMSFTGTSAVVRLDGGAEPAMHRLLGEQLEHHVAMVYGEQRGALHAVAAMLGVPVLPLTA
jgi:L-fucose isomerase-like protein